MQYTNRISCAKSYTNLASSVSKEERGGKFYEHDNIIIVTMGKYSFNLQTISNYGDKNKNKKRASTLAIH